MCKMSIISIELNCSLEDVEKRILSSLKHMNLSYEYPVSKRTNPHMIHDNEYTLSSIVVYDSSPTEIHIQECNTGGYRVNIYSSNETINNYTFICQD